MSSNDNSLVKRAKKKSKKGVGTIIFSRLFMLVLMVFLQVVAMVFFLANTDIFNELYYVIEIIKLFIVIYIVNEQKTDPTMKLIWVIVVLVIPVFGAILYLYVKFQFGSILIRKKIAEINERTHGYLSYDRKKKEELMKNHPMTVGLGNYIYGFSGYPIYTDVEVKYFSSGKKKFAALLEELKKAEKYIFLEYFIIEEGEMWNSVFDILCQKQKEGVEVRVIYDGMCSIVQLPMGYYKKVREKGIKCKLFAPMRPFLSTYQNNRDHRKIVVIDGKTVFTGGVNLADEYINGKERFGYWKDSAVMLKGEVANSFAVMFLRMWNIDSKEIENFEPYLNENKDYQIDSSRAGNVLGYSDEPFDSENISELVYMHLINTAKDNVHIITPYLIIDNVFMSALKFAAKRGVDVKIIMPGIPDKSYAYCVARTYYEELIEAGVKIYEFTPGFTHSKVFVVDGTKATVGTANLDYRSFFLHFECGALIFDSPEIKMVEEDFQTTLKASHRVTLQECRNRNFLYKYAGKILRMIAPLL
ncbi:MAG: cardiolipin synthase [Lachnospiraceae bacterium]|nr:cardiolipin synthase [Lachnospiraceae bacterium]